MDKSKLKRKKVWMPIVGALVALGILSASQAQWIKEVLTAVTGG